MSVPVLQGDPVELSLVHVGAPVLVFAHPLGRRSLQCAMKPEGGELKNMHKIFLQVNIKVCFNIQYS